MRLKGYGLEWFGRFPAFAPVAESLMPGGIDFTPGRVADLIGKKVGVNRGGIGEYLLAKALAQNGISLDQMEKTYLGPADGAYAFSTCNVDALAVWDPTSRLPRCATRPGGLCGRAISDRRTRRLWLCATASSNAIRLDITTWTCEGRL